MIGYRVRRFLQAWREVDARVRAFLAWNAANTLGAFALLLSAFALLVLASAPGYQRSLLLGYITAAVCWLVSVFAIGPAYERFVPPEARE
ncbi:MAG: hypothetical protein V5A44_05070 [Haloarculaceae archaeon]